MKKQYKIAIGAAVSGALLLAGCDTALSGVDPRALSSAISELNDVAVSVGEQLETLEIPAVGSAAPIVQAPAVPEAPAQPPASDIPGVTQPTAPEPSAEAAEPAQTQAPETAVTQPTEAAKPSSKVTPKASTKVTPKPAATQAPQPTKAPASKPAAAQTAAASAKPAADAALAPKPSLAAVPYLPSLPPASHSVTPAPEETQPAVTIPPQPSETPVPAPIEADIHIPGKDATLTINAQESVTAEPDIAHVFLGVKAQGSSATAAQEENNKLTQSFLDAIKAAGVADDDIETSNFNVYQDYDNQYIYHAETSFMVTIRDISKVGEVIDAAIQGGANSSYSLSFDVEDRDALYLRALSKAVQAVQMKAKAIADAGGFTIKSTKAITEGGTSAYYDRAAGVEYAAANDGGMSKMSVIPGDIEVSATVSGEFNIE